MSLRKMAALTATIIGAVGAFGSLGVWVHAELVVPAIVKQCNENADARLRAVLELHGSRPHEGAVTSAELEHVVSAIDRVERNLAARMTTLERAVLNR